MQKSERDIKRLATAKGIKKLYHFTHVSNIASILKNGLASQRLLQAHNIEFFAPDPLRLDNFPEAVSVSIEWFNHSLLLKQMGQYGGDWVILEIDASVLWTHACRFCWTNAAAAEVIHHTGFLGGKWAFSRMFDDMQVSWKDNRSFRETFKRPACRPTDNQAEVQVFEPIDSDLIIDLTVKNQRVERGLESLMENIGVRRPIVIGEQAFERQDAVVS